MLYFTQKDKTTLLAYARYIICRELCNEYIHFELNNEFLNLYSAKCGLFVSLYNQDQLRACLGRITSDLPLYKTIEEMSIAAATRDHRFDKVEAEEVKNISIELSVLSPLQKIQSKEEIELGKHGIYVEWSGLSGTFLPQVATNQNWTVDEFLGHCAESKAGLGWDGWKEANLYIYEVVSMKEN